MKDNSLNKPDLMAKDELREQILNIMREHFMRTGNKFDDKVIGELYAYTTNKIIEEMEHIDFSLSSSIKDHTVGMTIIENRIAELKALNHRKDKDE